MKVRINILNESAVTRRLNKYSLFKRVARRKPLMFKKSLKARFLKKKKKKKRSEQISSGQMRPRWSGLTLMSSTMSGEKTSTAFQLITIVKHISGGVMTLGCFTLSEPG